MSLFRNDRLSIAFRMDAIALRMTRHDGRLDRDASALLPIPADSGASPSWQAGIDLLEKKLAQLSLRLPANVILSDRFARLALLPWSDTVKREDQRNALALACLESHYGDMDGWTVRIDRSEYGSPYLACAVETALIEAARAVFDSRRLVCPSVEPFFVTCWNHWCREIGKKDALFALQETGLTVASIRNGRWHSLRRLGHCADSAEIMRILAREALLQGFDETPEAYLHVPEWSDPPELAGNAALHWLALPPEEEAEAPRHVAWTMARLGSIS